MFDSSDTKLVRHIRGKMSGQNEWLAKAEDVSALWDFFYLQWNNVLTTYLLDGAILVPEQKSTFLGR